MKNLVLLTVVTVSLACDDQNSDCDNGGRLMPWPQELEDSGSGSGYSDILTPEPTVEPTTTSFPLTTLAPTPPLPSDKPPFFTSAFFTSTIFLAAAACGASVLLGLLFVCCAVVICRKKIRKCCRCRCPCSRRSTPIEGPFISVSFRSSYQGDRESYYIRTNELGPTTFYTRPGEDDANVEFTAAFYTPKTNPSFRTLERERKALCQQPMENKEEEIEDEFIQELDNLEKVLDSALVRFETTTL